MSKPTYAQIAEAAKVGTATVERVLNGRGGVSEGTAQKVVAAARALDWGGRLPDRHRGIVRIEVMLVRPDGTFFARLAQAFKRISATLDPTLQVHLSFVDENDSDEIAKRILRPATRRSGLIVCAPDHPRIANALEQISAAGQRIVQIVTRIKADSDFVGIDNYAAGRMAGMMMSRLGAEAGTVVALSHSARYQVHRDRIRGFSDFLQQHPRDDLKFRHIAFGGDDRMAGMRWVAEAFDKWPDLSGFYNVGGGNSGVFDGLRNLDRKVFFVGHELSDSATAALQDGTADIIFDQLPETQARRSLDIILSKLGYIETTVTNPPIRFATITAENI